MSKLELFLFLLFASVVFLTFGLGYLIIAESLTL